MPAPTPDHDLDTLGALLRAARIAKPSPADPSRSMSQDDLAELIGITQSAVSAIESGNRRTLDASIALALARALDLDANDILEAADLRKHGRRSGCLDVDGRVVLGEAAGTLADEPSPIDLTPRPDRRRSLDADPDSSAA